MRTLILDDFTRYELGDGAWYLSAIVGGYEITLEPHTFFGWSVGIYKAGSRRWALKKIPVYFRNHPKDQWRDEMETSLLASAIEKANQLINEPNYYGVQQQSAAK
jgi:hypothetical protein